MLGRKANNNKDRDIIIPIMGATGTGKSTFINHAAGKNVVSVGHDLQSHTATIEPVTIPDPRDNGRNIVLVDTPGFDDTYVDDLEILKLIAKWLEASYKKGTKVAGIIYLHEISQHRMIGTSRKNFEMFGKLCGKDAAKNVILATTKWSDVKEDVGQRREKQLSNAYWKEMLSLGSRMARLENQQSASHIVDLILEKQPVDSVLIQEELVDLQKRLPETEAGVTLRSALQTLARQLKEETESRGKDPGYVETMKQLDSTLKQVQELKIPLGRRLASFISFRGHRQRGVTVNVES